MASDASSAPLAPTCTSKWEVDMHCGGCERVVRAVLTKTPGVQTVNIDLPLKKVEVTGTASEDAVKAALVKSGKAFKRLEAA